MSPRYAVKGKIGAGGLGEVYLATDTQLDRDVALKRVKPPETGSADTLHADLIREARTLSSLQHPHIVTIYDVGQDEQGPFVVMELLKGETLDQVIERGALTVEDFKEVVVQTLEGMIAAQELGLVHRDLKPGNLMVIWLASGKFQIKILDFGLAKFSRTATRQTEDQEAGIMGSIFFMAPEQFERLPLDARTDMYSLGCIFYQILTTQYPFDGQTGPEVMVSHLQHHVRNLVEARPDLPVWLADWVMWLISRDMEERPADARIALDFFRAQQSGIKNPTPVAPANRAPAVKIVGRGTGPGATTQQVPGKHTQPVSGRATQPIAGRGGSASQRLQGTTAASRSSRPAAKKVAASNSRAGLWITLALLAAGGAGAAWYLNRPPTVTEDPRLALDTLFANPNPTADNPTIGLLLTALRSNGPDAPKAAALLKKLKSPTLPDILAAELPKTTGSARLILIEILAAHPSKAGNTQLLKIITDESGPLRTAALETFVKSATADSVPDLLAILTKTKDAAGRENLLRSASLLLASEKDPASRVRPLTDALRSADSATRPEILKLLSQVPHPNATRALTAEIASPGDRRSDALAVLDQWAAPDTTLTDALLAAASSPTDRDTLLAAFCRTAPRIASINGAELVALLQKAQPLSTSAKTREALCAALAQTPVAEAAALAKQLAADPAWSAPATKALADITALQANVIAITPNAETRLDASKAVILSAEKDAYYTSTSRYITNWKNPASRVAWDVTASAPLTVSIDVLQSSSLRHDRSFRLRLGTAALETPVTPTDTNESFTPIPAGKFVIPRPGTWRLWLEPARMEPNQPLFNIRELLIKNP